MPADVPGSSTKNTVEDKDWLAAQVKDIDVQRENIIIVSIRACRTINCRLTTTHGDMA